VAIAPLQARNPKSFYLGKLGLSHLPKLRQVPEKEPSMHDSDNYGKPCISDTFPKSMKGSSSITYSLNDPDGSCTHDQMTRKRRIPLQLSPPLSLQLDQAA
jgi:hypothetical protein